MSDLPTAPPVHRPRWLWPVAGVLLVVGLIAAGAGYVLQQRQQADTLANQLQQQVSALEQSLQALRADQRANARALQDAASGNRLLRDEVLGLSQRNALLEENVARLSADSRQSLLALRQDEAEVVLGQALQRLEHGHDLDGARRLYALAATLLQDLEGPGLLDLRQALVQEKRALDALGEDPRRSQARALDQVLKTLLTLEHHSQATPAAQLQWWQRLLSPLVEIHPSDASVLLVDAQRVHGLDALQLEASLARAALERGDQEGWARAVARINDWVVRLWPDSPARQRQQQALENMRQTSLSLAPAELGSTLRQMRQLRQGGTAE